MWYTRVYAPYYTRVYTTPLVYASLLHPGYTLHAGYTDRLDCTAAPRARGAAQTPWAQDGRKPWAEVSREHKVDKCVRNGMHARVRARVRCCNIG